MPHKTEQPKPKVAMDIEDVPKAERVQLMRLDFSEGLRATVVRNLRFALFCHQVEVGRLMTHVEQTNCPACSPILHSSIVEKARLDFILRELEGDASRDGHITPDEVARIVEDKIGKGVELSPANLGDVIMHFVSTGLGPQFEAWLQPNQPDLAEIVQVHLRRVTELDAYLDKSAAEREASLGDILAEGADDHDVSGRIVDPMGNAFDIPDGVTLSPSTRTAH